MDDDSCIPVCFYFAEGVFIFMAARHMYIYKEHAWETWRVSSLGKVKEVSDSDREGQNSKGALI